LAGAEPPITLVLVGPTGVGKTAVVAALAERRPLAVISADSRQVYRGLDIGTAKPPAHLVDAVPHYGLDVVAIGERYSAGRFARDAARWLAEIVRSGRQALVVGGTGFYVRALVEGLFREPALDSARRDPLRSWTERQPREALARWAMRLDPGFTGGGAQRAARAIEVALLSGRPLTWWQREARGRAVLKPWYVRLTLPRAELQRRIRHRAEAIVAGGIVDEARAALAAGYPPTAPGLDAIGYREAIACLEQRLAMADLASSIAAATRRYAKRQETWLRHQLVGGPVWALDATAPPGELASAIETRWTREAAA